MAQMSDTLETVSIWPLGEDTQTDRQTESVVRTRTSFRTNHSRYPFFASKIASAHITYICLKHKSKVKSKAVPLHAMEALGGRGGIAPTHSRPRH
jgi:hypothetical protein